MEAGSDGEEISNGVGEMGKILLIVVIAFSDKPTVKYEVEMKSTIDCYEQAIELSKNPPIGDNVVKYLIGCLFEDHLPITPTGGMNP